MDVNRQTHTDNYCNPLAHVRRGLITHKGNAWEPKLYMHVWQHYFHYVHAFKYYMTLLMT